MDIFNMQRDNNIPIKPYEVRAHKYKIWNNITQQYDDFTGGGGVDPTPLPEYLRTDYIHMKNLGSTEQLKIRNTGLTLIKDESEVELDTDTILQDRNNIQYITNKVNEVSSSPAAVTDNNSIITYDSVNDKLRRTDHIKLNNGTNSLQISPDSIHLENGSVAADINITNVNTLTRLQSAVDTTSSDMNPADKLIAVTSNGSFRILNSIKISNSTGSKGVTITQNAVQLDGGGFAPSMLTNISLNNIRSLLNGITSNPDNTNMITYNPVTKNYNYTPIPSGSTPLPTWVETDRAYFTKGEGESMNGTIIDGDGILVRTTMTNPTPPNGDRVLINNSGVTAGRWGASTQKTVLKRTGIEFWDTEPTPVKLVREDVLKLKNLPDAAVINKIQGIYDRMWTSPDTVTLGSVSYNDIDPVPIDPATDLYAIRNFNKPLYEFPDFHSPDYVLRLNMDSWNYPVDKIIYQGFVIRPGLLDYVGNPSLTLTYYPREPDTSAFDITWKKVKCTPSADGSGPARSGIWIGFKASENLTGHIGGILKIKINDVFSYPRYGRIISEFATPHVFT